MGAISGHGGCDRFRIIGLDFPIPGLDAAIHDDIVHEATWIAEARWCFIEADFTAAPPLDTATPPVILSLVHWPCRASFLVQSMLLLSTFPKTTPFTQLFNLDEVIAVAPRGSLSSTGLYPAGRPRLGRGQTMRRPAGYYLVHYPRASRPCHRPKCSKHPCLLASVRRP
jgi:hypothetical protein